MPDDTLVTKTGRVLTDADVEALADEAEQGYDVSHLKNRPVPQSFADAAFIDRVDASLRSAISAEFDARTPADLADLLIALDALKRTVGVAVSDLEVALAERTEAGELVRGERMVKRDKRVSMSAPKHEELVGEVLRRNRIDRETGEMKDALSAAEIFAALMRAYALHVGNVRKNELKALGIDIRDYVTVTETPVMKVI